MKKILAAMVSAGFILLSLGCQENKTRVAEGGVIGGVVGAAAGGIIGQQMHRGAEGAVIGAAVGAAGGALIGAQINKPQPPASTTSTPAAQSVNKNQVTIQQVIELTKQGVSENAIIDKIRQTNSKFSLTDNDVAYLKQQGVSQKVIDVMQGK